MSIADTWFLVVAGLLVLTAYRGLKAGRFAFTHEPRLVTDRSNCPFWLWGQFALIICMIVVLMLGAAL